MSALSVLLSTPLPSEAAAVQQKCYVSYHLSALSDAPGSTKKDACVTLLENRSLISAAGTTGLRTWEAALHLGQFLCQNSSVIQGKRVLELGAGTGYLSILCARYVGATHVIASDGSDDVINALPENLFLNGLQESSLVTPMDLKWGHALVGTEEETWNGGRPVDVALGADVTYDQSVIPALVGTLVDLFALHPSVDVYISATKRNDETFGAFLRACGDQALEVDDVVFEVPSSAEQRGPFYGDEIPIAIHRVSKRN
jgi:predicted nicotinamide N-methyase